MMVTKAMTLAKMGRSMKNREIIGRWFSGLPLGAGGCLGAGAAGLAFLDRGHRLAGKGPQLPADDDPFIPGQTLLDHPAVVHLGAQS